MSPKALDGSPGPRGRLRRGAVPSRLARRHRFQEALRDVLAGHHALAASLRVPAMGTTPLTAPPPEPRCPTPNGKEKTEQQQLSFIGGGSIKCDNSPTLSGSLLEF